MRIIVALVVSVVLTLVGVPAYAGTSAAATISPLGSVDELSPWFGERRLDLVDRGILDGTGVWSAITDLVAIELKGTSDAIDSVSIDALLSEPGSATAGVLTTVRDAVDRFAPDGRSFLDHVLRHPARDGTMSLRQVRLGDRLVRAWSRLPEDRLTLVITAAEPGYAVQRLRGDHPCRALDPATLGSALELRVDLGLTIRAAPKAAGGRIWIVLDEPGQVDGAADVLRTDWDSAGSVHDRSSGLLVIAGPRLEPGQRVTLRWRIRYPDVRDHWLEPRVLIGPEPVEPVDGSQVSALRALPAIEAFEAELVRSEPCRDRMERPIRDEPTAAARIPDALTRLRPIDEHLRVKMFAPRHLPPDQLRRIVDLRAWAADEASWAEALDPRLLARSAWWREWAATTRALAVLAGHTIADRGSGASAVTMMELLHHLHGSLVPRSDVAVAGAAGPAS